MKHILFVITRSDEIGGAHVHVRDLSLWLQSRGYQVSIVVGGSGFYIEHLRDHGLHVYPCRSMGRAINPVRDIKALIQLRRLIVGLAPDLVSLHSAKAGLLGRILVCLGLNTPCLFTAHGWSFADGIAPLQKLLYLHIERWASQYCKLIITVCQSDLTLAIESRVAQASQLICIHNGMPDLPQPARLPWSRSRCLYLISVARFESQKDHHTMISALSQLSAFDWHLNLIGDGSGRQSIEHYVMEMGLQDRISFLGRSNCVAELLASSDLFLLISHWEGFPRSILEAMRSGLPVIASDVGGVHESVQLGVNGWLIPPSNPVALKNALLEAFHNPSMLAEFGQAGRALFEQKFEFQSMAAKTESVYKAIWSSCE